MHIFEFTNKMHNFIVFFVVVVNVALSLQRREQRKAQSNSRQKNRSDSVLLPPGFSQMISIRQIEIQRNVTVCIFAWLYTIVPHYFLC